MCVVDRTDAVPTHHYTSHVITHTMSVGYVMTDVHHSPHAYHTLSVRGKITNTLAVTPLTYDIYNIYLQHTTSIATISMA